MKRLLILIPLLLILAGCDPGSGAPGDALTETPAANPDVPPTSQNQNRTPVPDPPLVEETNQPGSPMPNSPMNVREEPINVPFQMTVGDNVFTDKGAITIIFVGVTQDSRCPLDVECVWAGNVTVALDVQVGDQPVEEIAITLDRDSAEQQVGDYLLVLTEVNPYPTQASASIDPSSYNIVLEVRR